jgi:hypothetical protein
MLESSLKLVPLVGHLRQPHVRGARSRQGSAAGWSGDLQRLLVDGECRVQAALGALHLSELLVASGRQDGLADWPPLADSRRQQAPGVIESAAKPIGQCQLQLGDRVQQLVVAA